MTPKHQSDGWLTVKEAAQHLRVKTRTLLSWAREGKVRGYILSGSKRHCWRFRQEDLDAALRLTSTDVIPVVRCSPPSVLAPKGDGQ